MFKYAQYFAIRHRKVIEEEKAIEVVLNLDNAEERPLTQVQESETLSTEHHHPRHGMSITAEIAAVPAALINQDGTLRRNDTRSGMAGRTISVRLNQTGRPERAV
jgi:hypothetical protein